MSIPSRRSNTNTNTAGSKDLSFGNTTPKTGDTIFSQISGISATRPDGTVITAGTSYFENQPYLAVFKHGTNGELDPDYQPVFVPTTESVTLFNLTIQSDGKPLMLFSLGVAQTAMVVRFNSDGTPDNGFGTAGTTSLNIRIYAGLLPRSGLSVQADGKILIAFRSTTDSYIFQLDSSGALVNFGKADPIRLASSVITALLITPTGFVVGGSRASQAMLLGYEASGDPDSRFGNNGEVVISQDDLAVSALAIGPLDAIGVVGASRYYPQETNFIAKVLPDGTPSQEFNQGNPRVTNTDAGSYTSLVFQGDGKMVALARQDARGSLVNLVRHTLSGQWDNTFGIGGVAEAYRDPQGRPLTSSVDKLELAQPNDKLQTSGHVSGASFIGRLLSV